MGHKNKKPRADAPKPLPPTTAPESATTATAAAGQRAFAIPYTAAMDILLIGEADFSFSASLARHLGTGARLVCTAFDAEELTGSGASNSETVLAMPTGAAAADSLTGAEAVRGHSYARTRANCAELMQLGATVVHNVDATKLQSAILPGDVDRTAELTSTESADNATVADARAFDFYDGEAPRHRAADGDDDDDDDYNEAGSKGSQRRKQRDLADANRAIAVRQFDRVVFLFPHSGVEFSPEAGYTESIQSNQQLLQGT